MKEKYRIQCRFEFGGQCLWAIGPTTWKKFGNAIEVEKLPLSKETIEHVREMIRWYETSLNRANPLRPGPWTKEEKEKFEQATAELMETLRKELGKTFEIVGPDYIWLPPKRENTTYVAPPDATVRAYAAAVLSDISKLDGKPIDLETRAGFTQFVNVMIRIMVKQANKRGE